MAVARSASRSAGQPVVRPAGRLAFWRRALLSVLIAGALAGLVAAIVVFAANTVMDNRYSAIVRQGAVSVDAAQDARAAILDNAGANADLLAGSADARTAARDRANKSFASFRDHLRVSWQNRTDQTQGEFAAFDAADQASADYAAHIGAMDAAVDANRPDDAHTAFLSAYDVLNQRLLPALAGLQAVKVEFMESEYASTSSIVRGWLIATVAISAVLLLIALVGLWLTRSMHRRLTIELVLAVLLVAGAGAWIGAQLRRGDTQAKVMVRDAYDTVAGVRDTVARVSQENALESIALFDPGGAKRHFDELADLNLQTEQGLCGSLHCTEQSFLEGSSGIAPSVMATALDGQNRFGIARTPLVANVRFSGEAGALEAARQNYQAFLKTDSDLQSKIPTGIAAAVAENAGIGQQQYIETVTKLSEAQASARSVYDSIRRSVQDAATIGKWLAAVEVAVALLIAGGLWRRRQELFVRNVR